MPKPICLSELIRDAFVRAAFKRAERDGGLDAVIMPTAPRPVDGAARKLEAV